MTLTNARHKRRILQCYRFPPEPLVCVTWRARGDTHLAYLSEILPTIAVHNQHLSRHEIGEALLRGSVFETPLRTFVIAGPV